MHILEILFQHGIEFHINMDYKKNEIYMVINHFQELYLVKGNYANI